MARTTRHPRQPRLLHKPTSEIVIDRKQSLELVRTVMTATVSAVAWCRNIFPRDRYAIRVYDYADPETSYESFMNGTHGKDFDFERSDDTVAWKVLTRNSDPAVNKLLDWLEVGVRDALELKVLSKVQLSFHTMDGVDVDDSNLIEAHIMTITYEDGVPRVTTETKTAKKHLPNTIVLRSAKQELRGIIQNVAWLTQDLDELPVQRRMTMKLMYNSTCPDDYEAPGFRSCIEQVSSILLGNRGTHAGTMSTGFHSVSVKVIQLNPAGVAQVPTQTRQAALEDGRCAGEGDESSASKQMSITTATRPLRGLRRGPSLPSEMHGDHTQEEGLRLFRSMGTGRDPMADTQDTMPVHSHPSPKGQARPMGGPASESPNPDGFRPYSQAVLDRIEAREEHVHIHSDDLDEARVAGPFLSCECKASGLEDRLIQCALCDDVQHVQCYGYIDNKPSRKHVCYTCLLETQDELLLEMHPLCIKRRALYYLYEKRVLNAIDDLAKYLNRNKEETVEILDTLKREGFLKAVPCTKKGKSKGLYTFVTNESKLRGEYFHPELKIAHYFEVPGTSSSGNTMTADSIDETLHSPASLSRQTLRSMNESRHVGPEDGSSTQGTPSPPVDTRRSSKIRQQNSDHNIHSYYEAQTSVPSKYSLSFPGGESSATSSAGESGQINRSGGVRRRLKHTLDMVEEVDPAKRAKLSSANSPFAFRRLED